VKNGSQTRLPASNPAAPLGALDRLPALALSEPYFDLLCFSHLRWDFVYQRPQHLLWRCAQQRRVFFVEEPVFGEVDHASLELHLRDGVTVVVPRLPAAEQPHAEKHVERLLSGLLRDQQISSYVSWYYTPMAIGFTAHLRPLAVVYDCMDELSLFKFAPPILKGREAELLRRSDLVFTGGQSLFEAKREQHRNAHLFPSSIDHAHFAKARQPRLVDPSDQRLIPHPRLGYCGVLDERLDLELIRDVAAARPDWHLVMLGPVVKIAREDLPVLPNIHYLGPKAYRELPEYMAGWDVALLPFALNEATRFISPTKTPEYLAAGKPVVSTPVRDVVRSYGEAGLVRIAADSSQFVSAIEAALAGNQRDWLASVDRHLAGNSWDMTWQAMNELILAALRDRRRLGTREGLGV
jgi:glycosyltransferase involved in cell wall biosynthesis